MPLRGEVKRTIVIANEKSNVQAAESCDNFLRRKNFQAAESCDNSLSEAGYELARLQSEAAQELPSS